MRIFLAGHSGMVGKAMLRQLQTRGTAVEILTRSKQDLDLTDEAAVRRFLTAERPDTVVLAAAKVGGILENDRYPADFIYQNLMIAANVIHQSFAAGVNRLLFLGSSCVYPREAEQPLREAALLSGPLEPTNEPYAIAKIAGIKLCESYNRQHGTDFRSVMPCNLYGPGDNFHLENSHVLPAFIRRFHAAVRDGRDEVTIWGTGAPRREFLHVDDMAAASLFVLDLDREVYAAETLPMVSHINVGWGADISIRELAELVAEVTGFRGAITYDSSKPDGTPRKLLDTSRLARLGWRPRIELRTGILDTYRWYLKRESGKGVAEASRVTLETDE
jgi:nucleoside-diphosphate-sugar epimerase